MLLALADRARSLLINAAAQILSASWIASVAIWRWVPDERRGLAFAGIDLSLTIAFFLMSRDRWFPVPLFFLEALLVIQDVIGAAAGGKIFWLAIVLNRVFEIELFYVGACAVYRIGKLARKQKDAP
ncbi:MAG TPA: hypothetical protein VNH64_00125 [Parvularculaceae bacterium]|nr:hypothetical protein [Parvularculaceae bacterium]